MYMCISDAISSAGRFAAKHESAGPATVAAVMLIADHKARRTATKLPLRALDASLADLMASQGLIAAVLNPASASILKDLLQVVGAHCLGLAEAVMASKDCSDAVVSERECQRAKFAARKFAFEVSSPVVSPLRKLRVLVKVTGGIAGAIDRLESVAGRTRKEAQANRDLIYAAKFDLGKRLIQSAAVCVAWLESFEQGGAK